MSTEIFIFSPRDEYLATLTEENGLVSAILKDKLNNVSSEPLTIEFESDSEVAVHIKDEHRVVVRDREGKFREYVIIEEDDLNDDEGPISDVVCTPSFMYELSKKVIEDRRFVDKGPEDAWQAALSGTRFEGEVIGSFGNATTNFYYLTSVEALWKTRDVWGGDIESLVELSENNTHIERRIMNLRLRLGADRGARFEIGHNIKEIQRTVLSEPVTALYGRGASLEILDEDGNPTGGHTRYIDFADVEWKKSNGDPVDKPLGQKWVGDPEALVKFGLEKDGQLLHLEDIYSNQNIEDEEELLEYTWDHLQNSQTPEVNYRLSVELIDRPVELGDTAVAIDREFTRPIEIQSRVIGIEYDLMDIEETTEVEMGQNLTLRDAEDEFREELENIKNNLNKPRPTKPIDGNSFPDIKPTTPSNVEAEGLFDAIMVSWDYDYAVYISHYEVYGSQVKDFVPDSQHLLWRGDVSSYIHEVEGDQQWYYRVRAVNTRGTTSEWSPQVTASSRRIMSTDILFGEIKAEHLAENLELADKLSQGTVDWINETPLQSAQNALDKALEGLYTAQDALSEAGQSFSLAQEAFDQSQEAFDQAQENATIIGSLALRIQSNNLISHSRLFSIAQSGVLFVYFGLDANASGDDSFPVKVEGGKTYTFKDFSVLEYADYPGGSVDFTLACFSSEDINTTELFQLPGNKDSLTFTVPTGMDRVMITVSYIVPEGEPYPELLIGTKVKVKLIEGEYMDNWSLHDEDPYLQYTTITGTVDGLQTQVSDIDGNLTTVTQLAQGLQTQVSDNTGNIANVTLIATGLQSTLSDVEGNVSNLLQTSTLFESRLSSVENWEFGGRNLISGTSNEYVSFETTAYNVLIYRVESESALDVFDGGTFTTSATFEEIIEDGASGVSLGVSFRNKDGTAIAQYYGDVLNVGYTGKNVFTHTFPKHPYEKGDYIEVHIRNRASGSLIKGSVRGMKFEKGNKATDWTPAPEDIDNRMTTAESTITQHATAISQRVTQTVYNQNRQGDIQRFENAETLIQQNATSITQRVTKTEFDGLEIGGRNLFRPSKITNLVFGGSPSNSTLVSGSNYKGYHIKVKEGEVYSFSRESRINNRHEYGFTIDEPVAGVEVHGWVRDRSEEPLKYEGIVVPEGMNYLVLYLTNQNDELPNIKLEKGNKATDWSPAPEDMATRAQVSLISQEVDNIQLTVVDIQDDLGDAQGMISLIDQKADNISLSINSLEGDLSNWGVGGRNLFSYTLLEDLGFTWVTNTQSVVPIPEGTTHITYSRSGVNPLSSGEYLSVSFLPAKGRTPIRSENFNHLTVSRSTSVPLNARYISFGVLADGLTLSDIKNAKFQVEAGQKRSPYSLAYEDAIGVTNSLAFINLSEDGIRLHGSKVQISGQTQIEDAVIGTAAIADAAIKRAHLQDAIIDTAHIGNLAVTSAKIGSLAVTTAKIATAAVTNAKIASLSVDKLTGSIATFIKDGFNGVSSQVEITGSGLETFTGGQLTSRLNGSGHHFYRNNTNLGFIGTAAWAGDSNYRGLLFSLENEADYMVWAFRKNASDTNTTTMLSWHKTGSKTNAGFHMDDNVHIRDDVFFNGALATQSSTGYRTARLSNWNIGGVAGVGLRRGRSGGAGIFLTDTRAALVGRGSVGVATIEARGSGEYGYIQSMPIYNRTYTATSQMVRVTGDGVLGRSTSSRRYKLQEEAVSLDFAKKILQVQAKSWYDKQACEDYSHYLLTGEGEGRETISRIGGVIAEDVHDVGLGMYVNYDELGRPDGIESNLWTLLIPVLKDHIETTEENFDHLALKYDILKQRATHLEQRVSHLEQILEVSK